MRYYMGRGNVSVVLLNDERFQLNRRPGPVPIVELIARRLDCRVMDVVDTVKVALWSGRPAEYQHSIAQVAMALQCVLRCISCQRKIGRTLSQVRRLLASRCNVYSGASDISGIITSGRRTRSPLKPAFHRVSNRAVGGS